MSKVLITDNVAAEGVDLLKKHVTVDVKRGLSPDELIATIPGYDALVVRSETKVTEPVIAAGATCRWSPAPASGWTTSTWTPPPGPESPWSTRPSETRWLPPSIPSR